MSAPLRMSVRQFRALCGFLSGEIWVSNKMSRRRGAREVNRHQKTESRPSFAGPGDGSGPTDGGSAESSSARSTDRGPGAGSAEGQGEEPKRALVPGKEQWAPAFEYPIKELRPTREMPENSWEFTQAVHAGVQTVAVMQGFLGSKDEKVRLRAFELWVDLAYGKYSQKREEQRTVGGEWSIPRPERD